MKCKDMTNELIIYIELFLNQKSYPWVEDRKRHKWKLEVLSKKFITLPLLYNLITEDMELNDHSFNQKPFEILILNRTAWQQLENVRKCKIPIIERNTNGIPQKSPINPIKFTISFCQFIDFGFVTYLPFLIFTNLAVHLRIIKSFAKFTTSSFDQFNFSQLFI